VTSSEILLIILCAPIAAIAIGILVIGICFRIDKDMFTDMELDSDTDEF
jgi:uncharacterized membrane protein YhdT